MLLDIDFACPRLFGLMQIQVSLLKGLSARSWVCLTLSLEPCFQGGAFCVFGSLRPIQTWLATSRAFWKMVVCCSSSWPWLRLFHTRHFRKRKAGNRTAYPVAWSNAAHNWSSYSTSSKEFDCLTSSMHYIVTTCSACLSADALFQQSSCPIFFFFLTRMGIFAK